MTSASRHRGPRRRAPSRLQVSAVDAAGNVSQRHAGRLRRQHSAGSCRPGSRGRERLAADERLRSLMGEPAEQRQRRSLVPTGSSAAPTEAVPRRASEPDRSDAKAARSPRARTRGISPASSGSKTPQATSARRTRRCRSPSASIPSRQSSRFSAPDPADPLRVAVTRIDRLLRDGERRDRDARQSATSTWHGLPTELQGSELVAYVDDERFRRGSYEFRARGEDQAGNEASTGKRTDGSAATFRLPARIDTRLAVGAPRGARGNAGVDRRTCSLATGACCVCAGRLTNADGQPTRRRPRSKPSRRGPMAQPCRSALRRPIATGRFRYVLRATRNRDVAVPLRAARGESAPPPPASICTCRARPRFESTDASSETARAVLFTGRVVDADPCPPNGQAASRCRRYFRGRWRTFSTLRTDRRGALEIPLPLRRYPRPRDVPLPRPAAVGGRLSVRRRDVSRVAKVVVLGP